MHNSHTKQLVKPHMYCFIFDKSFGPVWAETIQFKNCLHIDPSNVQDGRAYTFYCTNIVSLDILFYRRCVMTTVMRAS